MARAILERAVVGDLEFMVLPRDRVEGPMLVPIEAAGDGPGAVSFRFVTEGIEDDNPGD